MASPNDNFNAASDGVGIPTASASSPPQFQQTGNFQLGPPVGPPPDSAPLLGPPAGPPPLDVEGLAEKIFIHNR
ncbi:3519_t:CDS:2 [Ambispora gerdemannii]|uniref:3519_t:CDS:1 n=1 Tax=Ambispora gerdemannii TaxID=144530 RepID=A0A9N9DW74_9GLOM|nr:3519_t:CDS:2 [Ambispora gerdemannii]